MKIIGIGEVVWDCFPEGKRLGGTPINFCFFAKDLVFTFRLCRLHGNVADFYFPAMFLLTLPTFAFVEQLQVTPVHGCTDIALYVFLPYRSFLPHE